MPDAASEQTVQPVSLFELMSQTVEQLYLVVDRILIPEFDEFWDSFASRPDWEWQFLYRGSKLRAFKAGSPIVVPMSNGSPGETLFYWLLEQVDYRWRFGLIIHSTLSLDELTEQLRRWALIEFPNQQQALFRFFDSSVLRQAWSVLTLYQKEVLMQGIEAIYVPDSDDNERPLLLLARADELQSEMTGDEFELLRLTQAQYDTLFYDERLESIIRVLTQKLNQSRTEAVSFEQVCKQFMLGLAQGRERFPHQSQLAYETYALYRFYLAGDFDLHPEFQQILKFNELRAAIGRFDQLFRSRPEALAQYSPIQFEPIADKDQSCQL